MQGGVVTEAVFVGVTNNKVGVPETVGMRAAAGFA